MTIPIKNDASAAAMSRFVKSIMSFARDEGLKELFQKSANSKCQFLCLLYEMSRCSILLRVSRGQTGVNALNNKTKVNIKQEGNEQCTSV
jgi:CRISPR/Cas system-associated protein endoribonuclease Cas2